MRQPKQNRFTHRRDDYGEARSDHHTYDRGSMSDAEPYNEYNPQDDGHYGTETRQSYGRGYGADNSYQSGFNNQEVFGRAPSDNSYAANPGPAVERPHYLEQKMWDQDNGRWRSVEEFYGSSGHEGENL